MQIDSSQNFSMHYTTKNGNHLSLTMYDNQSINYDNDEKNLSLRRQYGFKFTFEGSKLTQNDLNEIKNAMKSVEPLLQNFLNHSNVNELKPKELIQTAMQIADILPTPSDENHQNIIAHNFTNKFNSLLKQTNDKNTIGSMLEDSTKLLEEVLKQIKERQKVKNKEKERDFKLYA